MRSLCGGELKHGRWLARANTQVVALRRRTTLLADAHRHQRGQGQGRQSYKHRSEDSVELGADSDTVLTVPSTHPLLSPC